MKQIKKIFTILLLLQLTGVANSQDLREITEDMLNSTMTRLITLQDNKTKDIRSIKKVIREEIVNKVDITTATRKVLSKNEKNFSKKEKKEIGNFILKNMTDEYSVLMSNYHVDEGYEIDVKIKKKTNQRSTVSAKLNEFNFEFLFYKTDVWKIYDVRYSGISLMNNYKQQIKSLMKRKGKERFMSIVLNGS